MKPIFTQPVQFSPNNHKLNLNYPQISAVCTNLPISAADDPVCAFCFSLWSFSRSSRHDVWFRLSIHFFHQPLYSLDLKVLGSPLPFSMILIAIPIPASPPQCHPLPWVQRTFLKYCKTSYTSFLCTGMHQGLTVYSHLTFRLIYVWNIHPIHQPNDQLMVEFSFSLFSVYITL